MRALIREQNKPRQQVQSNKTSSTAVSTAGHLHPNLHLQRTIGNQSEQSPPQLAKPDDMQARSEGSRFGHNFAHIRVYPKPPASFQAKLTVSSSGSIYEQEADRVSEQVMSMPEPQLQRVCDCGGSCTECQTHQQRYDYPQSEMMPLEANGFGRTAAPPSVHEVLRSPGQPLDRAIRAFMEPRFGYDFSNVRVHSSPTADRSVREMNAHAYTVGENIVFGSGQLAPMSRDGRRLIAHELTHVLQQRTGYAHGVQRDKKDPKKDPQCGKTPEPTPKGTVVPKKGKYKDQKITYQHRSGKHTKVAGCSVSELVHATTIDPAKLEGELSKFVQACKDGQRAYGSQLAKEGRSSYEELMLKALETGDPNDRFLTSADKKIGLRLGGKGCAASETYEVMDDPPNDPNSQFHLYPVEPRSFIA
jgi:hypothetical protein